MKKTKIETEFRDYNITAAGLIISGEVLNLQISFEGVDSRDVDSFERDLIEDHCREELLNSVYNPELRFEA